MRHCSDNRKIEAICQIPIEYQGEAEETLFIDFRFNRVAVSLSMMSR
jgi:hypothetical protein